MFTYKNQNAISDHFSDSEIKLFLQEIIISSNLNNSTQKFHIRIKQLPCLQFFILLIPKIFL